MGAQEQKIERRLVAIFAADVAGYSRLMSQDEVGTLQTLTAHRQIMDRLIVEHGGRIANTAGDSVLAEFPSAVDAVQCAVQVQEALAQSSQDTPEDARLQFRIGVHVGDVMVRGGDLLGAGVNIASRLEGLAEPGGVCISDDAYRQVRRALRLSYVDLGPQRVKNINEPVHAFIIHIAERLPANASTEPPSLRPLPLPDKPSIAVLPFTNMSGDPEDYFADGIVEDIITTLSKVADLFVIARNSTFVFKGKSLDPRAVARDLGVRYVVEGSLRRSGNRIRVTAQLIDGETGSSIWAERYDRNLEDIFTVQDEITAEITTALQVRLTEGEQVELRRWQTSNLVAWEEYIRGQAHLRTFARTDNAQARMHFARALSLEPMFATAWALLAWTYLVEGRLGWSRSSEEALLKGVEATERGMSINEKEPDAWAMLGGLRLYQRRYEEALEHGQRSVELAPSAADLLATYALTLNFAGNPAMALDCVEKAMRLSPYYPDWYLGAKGVALRLLNRLGEAIIVDHKRLERSPENEFSNLRLAAVYSQCGDLEAAKRHLVEALRKNPRFSARQVRIMDPYRDDAEMKRYVDLLHKAGLPE